MLWLKELGYDDVLRVNSDRATGAEQVFCAATLDDIYILSGTRKISSGEIKAVWYRKGQDWLAVPAQAQVAGHRRLTRALQSKVIAEGKAFSDYFYSELSARVPVLGRHDALDLNKLKVLKQARQCGLMVAESTASDNASWLKEFEAKHGPLITKSMTDGLYLFGKKSGEMGYFTYTEKVDLGEEKITNISFVQQHIDKEYDVRVFYLLGRSYGMAIFSQSHEQSKVDFRKYPIQRPNRAVPFALDGATAEAIDALCKSYDLNTASLDFVMGRNGKLVFLEINPVGQFGMVSKPCNYGLEKQVAQALIVMAKMGSRRLDWPPLHGS